MVLSEHHAVEGRVLVSTDADTTASATKIGTCGPPASRHSHHDYYCGACYYPYRSSIVLIVMTIIGCMRNSYYHAKKCS